MSERLFGAGDGLLAGLQLLRIMRESGKKLSELAGRGRVLLRYSGTESLARVMVEGENEDQVKRLAEDIAETVKVNLR